MTRAAIPLYIDDLSEFARKLSAELPDAAGHQTWLNLLSKAGGFKNWQHLRAVHGDKDPEPAPNMAQVRKAQRYFDARGFYSHLPKKLSLQLLCLWPVWARLDLRDGLTERELSHQINALTGFRDPAMLRRDMVESGMLRRTRDGSRYDRVERRPSPEARVLIASVPDPRLAN